MIPEEVFHYTKKDTAIEKIFYYRKLRLGQLKFTNDPKESKTRLYFDEEEHTPTDEWLKHFDAINHEANDILAKEWKILCVSQHQPGYRGVEDRFRGGDCRPRMWANYAENHQGVCLRFDGNKLNSQIEKELGEHSKCFYGPVEYDDVLSARYKKIKYLGIEELGIREGMRGHLLENWKEEFFVKSEDWQSEYEYRWLVHNTKDDAEYISIEGILTGVMIGVDFPKAYVPIIKEFCLDLGIPATRILWQNGNPIANYYDANYLK